MEGVLHISGTLQAAVEEAATPEAKGGPARQLRSNLAAAAPAAAASLQTARAALTAAPGPGRRHGLVCPSVHNLSSTMKRQNTSLGPGTQVSQNTFSVLAAPVHMHCLTCSQGLQGHWDKPLRRGPGLMRFRVSNSPMVTQSWVISEGF